MIDFMRSLFGLGGSSGNRKVVGNIVSVDLKDVAHIKESNSRLTILQNLQISYKGTPHEQKFKAVYERTKDIHSYLVSNNRAHELELFHLQHTDHFINTYTVILEVYQRHNGIPTSREVRQQFLESKPEKPQHVAEQVQVRSKAEVRTLQENVKRLNSQQSAAQTLTKSEVTKLVAPDIAIHTYSKIFYVDERASDEKATREIGFTSSKEEKEAFLSYTSNRLGIWPVSYFGNAMVTLPAKDGTTTAGYVPIIHWNGFTYAFDILDCRLFPVRMNRKGF
ncbi:hypothetical protein [Pontibacter sp. SGAir0037]|uniref:hypothetical protein n=1 Tax=Pontibacter sp. SGAir0037 TaxID=2571030 RepID=UPI0010CD4C7A|nr:hypothetical protein [Pontibacter sp. SGAir0037]QCR21547.1 hypothetical protein C1N53_03760 [Pontibacter sp. SGAir0037]